MRTYHKNFKVKIVEIKTKICNIYNICLKQVEQHEEEICNQIDDVSSICSYNSTVHRMDTHSEKISFTSDNETVSSSLSSVDNTSIDASLNVHSNTETLDSFENNTDNTVDNSSNREDSTFDINTYQDLLENNMHNMEDIEQNVPNTERYSLYTGCDLTLEESKLLILAFALRYNISDKALESLIQLIDCHLPSTQHRSLFMFFKDVPKTPSVHIHFYCYVKTCKRYIQFAENDVVTCECGARCERTYLTKAGYYFLHISLKDQLIKLLNYQFIREQLRWKCKNKDERDVINGDVYKRLLDNGMLSKRDITLQWNTDGIQVHKSSKMQLWPIQVCINELPFKIRKDNIVLCGL